MAAQVLTGRIKSKRRSFEEVVADLRHAIFSVIRLRPEGEGFRANALGSGFFVSSTVFLTCHHVISPQSNPHRDGDLYQLVSNLSGAHGVIHQIRPGIVGQNIHYFPESDLGLLISEANKNQAYMPISYADVKEGQEIGVAGYPLPQLQVINDQLTFGGLIFRVSKGTVTATYTTHISLEQGVNLSAVPVIEVDFLFVPGNSGGPIFDAETGRALGFVQSYNAVKIRERAIEATLINTIPDGYSKKYIEGLNAIYSIGIKLERVRPHLESFNVSL